MEQIRIAIVEDEAPHAELLKQHIESWRQHKGIKEILLQHFCHAQAFLFAWEEETYDMIFLDIQMPGINGMEAARKIRETDRGVKLVFTTGVTDYLQEGYEVDAIRYLLKPITQEKVWQCLDKMLQEPPPIPQLIFQTREGIVKLSEQEIEYFEARGHYTICHLVQDRQQPQPAGTSSGISNMELRKNGCEVRLQEGFNALCSRLCQRPFIRCHRSYLCHIRHIHRVERMEIILESGRRIPVSRSMYEQVVKAFIAYFRRESPEG